jgi:hypothetical protein
MVSSPSSVERKGWVYDIETLLNCFVVVFIGARDEETHTFVIHKLRDDREKLIRFLRDRVAGFCGFNSLDFDDKIIKWILDKSESMKPWDARDIYRAAQELIAGSRWLPGTKVTHQDLYLLHHFDNHAKATSLKWLQCHLGMETIQEMPIEHDTVIHSMEQIETIIKYCVNDVKTTKVLLQHKKTKELIEVRREMSKEYNLDFTNSSNSTMGERILLRSIPGAEESTPLKPSQFSLERVILPNIKFHTPEFQKLLEEMKKFVVDPTNEDAKPFSFSVNFNGMSYDYGLGGLHAARPRIMWDEIFTMDVESYYPNLAIENEWFPRHLGPRFTAGYKGLFLNRKALPKGTNKNKALKEALNSAFGKSNSAYSKLYDPLMTFAITVNGQLLLTMLCEAVERLGAGKVVMANTDGIEVIVYDMQMLEKIMKAWQKMTRLNLESDTYSRMLVRDVNNYVAISKTTGKIKAKGIYEVDKEFHKDPSAKIVATVIEHWFKNGCTQPIEEVYDIYKDKAELFFMFARAKTGKFLAVSKDGMRKLPLPKTIRYIITTTGYVLRKQTDKKSEKVHSEEYISLFNDLATFGMDEVPIDHGWYLREIKSLTEFGTTTKLALF